MKQKNSLKIIYIITKLELGGAQKVCLSLFNGLPEHMAPTYLISGTDGILTDKVKDNKNVLLLPNLKWHVSFSSIINEFKAFFDLIKKLKKLKLESKNIIVHTHSTKAGLLGRWAAFFAGIKNRVHTIHGYGFHKYQYKLVWAAIYFLELITSAITTHYICVSSKDALKGIRLFPRFSKKHSIIRAAIDCDSFIAAQKINTKDIDNKVFIFGTVSCFKPAKNLIDLLKAFTVVYHKNKNVRLEIIGDGILRNEIENWISEHDLKECVVLHGWQENIINFLTKWDAFVMSSLWEGLPCAVVEARALKLPVISYDTGGIKDIIINNQNGLIFEQNDWQSLSKGMLKISQDKILCEKLSNYQDDLCDFDNKQMIKQHLDLYKTIGKDKNEKIISES